MSPSCPVPVGHSALLEALERARVRFPAETKAHFRGLLLSGQLRAKCANAKGEIEDIKPEFWTTRGGVTAIDTDEIMPAVVTMRTQSRGRVVFLTTDLDQQLPTFAQVARMRREERKTRTAAQALTHDAQSSSPQPTKLESEPPTCVEAAPTALSEGTQAVKDTADLRIPGRIPVLKRKIIAEMQKMDKQELRNKKEKELEHLFGAARSTCRAARNEVLAENGAKPIPPKSPIAK